MSALLRAAAAVAFLAVGGCSALKAIDEPQDLYTLTPKTTFEEGLPTVRWQLVVEPPVSAAYLNTGRIALQMTPTSADYYARSAWTDRAPLLVQTLMVESFESTRRIVGVGRDPVTVRPNYVLQTELREFQVEYFRGRPPVAHVRIVARLVRFPDKQIVATRSFERCARAAADKVPAVVQAMDQALGTVLRRMVTWTLTVAPPQALAEGAPFVATRDVPASGEDTDRCRADGS
ncbi:MAG: membrane integrity-associated transporter subunit PqiC [Rhodospirillales bacterium]|nr:MAG: membrane integrity-associated transporter subunit PqiC [Rhodospirillales bacterium]